MKFFVSTHQPRPLPGLTTHHESQNSQSYQSAPSTDRFKETDTHFFPTTQCHVVPQILSASFFNHMAISFSTLYFSKAVKESSTTCCCISSDTDYQFIVSLSGDIAERIDELRVVSRVSDVLSTFLMMAFWGRSPRDGESRPDMANAEAGS